MAAKIPSSESGTSADEGDWQDVHQADDVDEEPLEVVSLFDARVFPDALSMLAYCREQHRFDFLAIRDRLSLDFHDSVKLINYIRQRVRDDMALPEDIRLEDFSGEQFLRPVLSDDALIMCLDELPDRVEQPRLSSGQEHAPDGGASGAGGLLQRNAELEAELQSLTKQFANYRLAVQQTLEKRWGVDSNVADESSGPADLNSTGHEAGEDDSHYYWESYAHNEIHETMLKDTVRTEAYRDFIYGNKHLFTDKIVLDIGCGTGILSMFCAKAGAKQVIAVDKSAIIDRARENVFRNDLGDKIVCLRGRVEDVTLPVDKVDVIVSEWMGYCLLYEAMLPSVIWARDRYLKPDGLLVPSHAGLWIAPVSDSEYFCDNVDFWRNVYGFDMQAMQADIYSDVHVQAMPKTSLCGTSYCFRLLDLHIVKTGDLVFDAAWSSKLSTGADDLDGFLVWFDIFFAPSREEAVAPDCSAQQWKSASRERVAFTTGPLGQETHWKQGLLPSFHRSRAGDMVIAPELSGVVSYSVPENSARALSLRVTWGSTPQDQRSQSWQLR